MMTTDGCLSFDGAIAGLVATGVLVAGEYPCVFRLRLCEFLGALGPMSGEDQHAALLVAKMLWEKRKLLPRDDVRAASLDIWALCPGFVACLDLARLTAQIRQNMLPKNEQELAILLQRVTASTAAARYWGDYQGPELAEFEFWLAWFKRVPFNTLTAENYTALCGKQLPAWTTL